MRLTHLALLASLNVACVSGPHDPAATVLPALPRLRSQFAPQAVAATVSGERIYRVEVGSAVFAVSVNSSTSRVSSISTRDPQFVSPDGASVGSPASALAHLGAQWHSVPSVGCVLLLPSGWRALVPSSQATSAQPATASAGTPSTLPSAPSLNPVTVPPCPPAHGAVSQLTLSIDDGA